jgi:hypothetical protein
MKFINHRKTEYSFGFLDAPNIRTPCASRQWLANYLRAARRNRYLRVKRSPWPTGDGYRTAQYCFSILHAPSRAEALILPLPRGSR